MHASRLSTSRTRWGAGLAACVVAASALFAPPLARAAGERPVISEVIFYWRHEQNPAEAGAFLWTMHFNLTGSDQDSELLKRRIFVFGHAGDQRMECTTTDLTAADLSDPSTHPGPALGFRDTDSATIAEVVGGHVLMWLEDYDGNLSDTVMLPISAPEAAISVRDVALDSRARTITVSGANLGAADQVTLNRKRVAPSAVTASADGTSLVVDLAAARLAGKKSYLVRVGSGRGRSNPAFVRR